MAHGKFPCHVAHTAILVIIAASLAGCGNPESDPRTLYLALETPPNKIDPALAVDVAGGQIVSLIYQGLVRFSPEGKLEPDAATEWEIEDDGHRYIFTMDRQARFSDGSAVTAGDVVSSFERVLSPRSLSSRRWVLDRIRGAGAFADGEAASVAGLSTRGDSVVVIDLEEPFRPFIELLGMPAARIVHANSGPANGESTDSIPVGSGMWMLGDWRRGDYVSLVPNLHHPQYSRNIDEIRYRIIPEAFTRIAEYESGTLDILKIPLAELDRYLSDAANSEFIQSRPELRVLYVGLNTQRGPLKDVRVRRALNMAVNVDQIINVLTGGRGIRATGSVPPTLGGYEERDAYPFDPQRARRELSAAGFPEGFSMEIWQRDSPDGNRIVEAIQGYLHEVGVEVRIVKREWSAFKEAVGQGKVDAFFLDWYADYPDAENFLYPLFHSANVGGGGNRAFLKNADVDALIERSHALTDPEEAWAVYAETDRMVYNLAPWIYLYFPRSFVLVSPRVRGYVYPALYLGEDFSMIQKN